MPVVAAIETVLNRSMLLWSEMPDHYFTLDTKELLKGDILKRYQAYQIALHEGFLQVDEVRYEEDKEPFNLNWIKLGLQDVLFDTKNHTIYTPNTNQTVKFGEFSIDKQNDGGIIEERGWVTINGKHVFIGDDGGGSGDGSNSGNKNEFKDSSLDDKAITNEAIENVPKLNVFDDEAKNARYQQANKNLLKEAQKHPVGTEVSRVYDANMNPIENHGYIIGKKAGEVKIDNPEQLYHAFHNHPTNNTLSVDDLINLTKHDSMLSITAVGKELLNN